MSFLRFSRTALIFLASFASYTPSASAQTSPLLYRGARVFDGTRTLTDTDVLVQAGRIVQIGRNLTAPANSQVIHAAGKTLLPGFIDAHTHVFGDALREALIFGVTTELDMFTEARGANALRSAQQAGNVPDRADLFSASTLVTAPGGHGTEYGMPIPTITRPESAQSFVDARIAEGSDYIKIVYDDGALFGLRWPTVTPTTLRALVHAAHNRGKLAVVHVSTAGSARDALQAGADGLVHLFTDSLPAADFVTVAREKNAFVIPTLVVLKSITGAGGAAPLLDDARIEPYLMPASRTLLEASFPARDAQGEKRFGYAVETVRRLNAAGVPVLAGTDAPNPGTAHGAALHRELELLVQAGLTPAAALASATSIPAHAFKLSDRGRIAVGQRADLILVNGDPTTDITATRNIEGVWKGGVAVDRVAYRNSVADAVAAASAPLKPIGPSLISDFEQSAPTASFGTTWILSLDSYAGGKSTGDIGITPDAANGKGALRITGTISDAVPYAWSGAMWSPGAQPMSPANLSATRELHFRTKGDGKTYRVILFAQSKGMNPVMREFVAAAEWREVSIPWSAFGVDGRDVMAIVIAGGPQPGSFSLMVDDVRIR